MSNFIKRYLPYVLAVIITSGLGIGISVTYGWYRGTELSRVPSRLPHGKRDVKGYDSYPASPLSQPQTDELMIYPTMQKGMRTPFDLWRYYGRGVSSFSSPLMPMRFDQWLAFHRKIFRSCWTNKRRGSLRSPRAGGCCSAGSPLFRF